MTTEADALIEEAERSARALLEDTEREVESMIEQGAVDGEREGAEQAAHMREEIAGLEVRMLKEVEGEVVKAALRVARDLATAELQNREDAVVDIVATALGAAKTARDINLRISPRDAPILRQHKQRLVAVLTRAKKLVANKHEARLNELLGPANRAALLEMLSKIVTCR